MRRAKDISNNVLNISTSYSFHCHHSDPSHYHLSLEPLRQQIASWLVHLHLLTPFWIIKHSTISVTFLKSQDWSFHISAPTPSVILHCVRIQILNEAFEVLCHQPSAISPATCHTSLPYPAYRLHCLSFIFHPASSSCICCPLCLEFITPSQIETPEVICSV